MPWLTFMIEGWPALFEPLVSTQERPSSDRMRVLPADDHSAILERVRSTFASAQPFIDSRRPVSKEHHSVGDMVITFLLRKNGDGWLAEEVDMHDVFRRPADVQQ